MSNTRAAKGSTVAVLGASPKEDRYSYKAVVMLGEHGHHPIPVHPAGHAVNGIPGKTSLDEITGPIDTLTIYVNADISSLGVRPDHPSQAASRHFQPRCGKRGSGRQTGGRRY